MIQSTIRWTWQSNACDVLSLGPRTAGRLATVGIRTVADLLSANPQAIGERLRDAQSRRELYSPAVIASWQREARLVVELPTLSPAAAQILSAIGCSSAERVARSAPTELLMMIDLLFRSGDRPSWLREENKPTIGEVCAWIGLAREQCTAKAA